MIPQVQDSMEGCPKSELNMLYMTLSAVLTLVLFLIFAVLREIKRASRSKQVATKQNKLRDAEFKDLQIELYGEDYMNRHHDMVTNSEHSSRQNSSHHLGGHQGSAHGSAATATAAVPDAPNKRPTAFAKKDDEVQA